MALFEKIQGPRAGNFTPATKSAWSNTLNTSTSGPLRHRHDQNSISRGDRVHRFLAETINQVKAAGIGTKVQSALLWATRAPCWRRHPKTGLESAGPPTPPGPGKKAAAFRDSVFGAQVDLRGTSTRWRRSCRAISGRADHLPGNVVQHLKDRFQRRRPRQQLARQPSLLISSRAMDTLSPADLTDRLTRAQAALERLGRFLTSRQAGTADHSRSAGGGGGLWNDNQNAQRF